MAYIDSIVSTAVSATVQVLCLAIAIVITKKRKQRTGRSYLIPFVALISVVTTSLIYSVGATHEAIASGVFGCAAIWFISDIRSKPKNISQIRKDLGYDDQD
jgi:hypothetical protein